MKLLKLETVQIAYYQVNPNGSPALVVVTPFGIFDHTGAFYSKADVHGGKWMYSFIANGTVQDPGLFVGNTNITQAEICDRVWEKYLSDCIVGEEVKQ